MVALAYCVFFMIFPPFVNVSLVSFMAPTVDPRQVVGTGLEGDLLCELWIKLKPNSCGSIFYTKEPCGKILSNLDVKSLLKL